MADGDEVWQTATQSMVYLVREDLKGAEQPFGVGGPGRAGQQFSISSTERAYNQQLVADERFDPFTNGLLSPVEVGADQPELQSPNALARSDMVRLFTLPLGKFKAALEPVTSEATLRTVREVAEEVDAKLTQIAYLNGRLEAFKPGKAQRSYAEIQGISASPRN